MGRIDTLASLIFIVIASCYAEQYKIMTADMPRRTNNRINYGSPVIIEEYPFVVQVIYVRWFRCGGSLVTTRHVLTAAHCVIGTRDDVVAPDTTSIRAGTHILKACGSVHAVKAIKVHDLYNFNGSENDVAVILMATPVDLTTSEARVAFLPYQDAMVPDDEYVTVIGWGTTDMANPSVITLLTEVTLKKINLNTCQASYSTNRNKTAEIFFNITSSMICAIVDDGVNATAKGDSGGPLLYNGIVVGVTSWSPRRRKFPGVYSRVSNYTNWINDTINDFLLQIELYNGTGNDNERANTGSLSSKLGAITPLISLLYFIICM